MFYTTYTVPTNKGYDKVVGTIGKDGRQLQSQV